MFGDITFLDQIEAQVKSYAADFLKAESRLIDLSRSTDQQIAYRANILYQEHKQLEVSVISAVQAIVKEKETGSYSFTTMNRSTQIVADMKRHLDQVNQLGDGGVVGMSWINDLSTLVIGVLGVTLVWALIWKRMITGR